MIPDLNHSSGFIELLSNYNVDVIWTDDLCQVSRGRAGYIYFRRNLNVECIATARARDTSGWGTDGRTGHLTRSWKLRRRPDSTAAFSFLTQQSVRSLGLDVLLDSPVVEFAKNQRILSRIPIRVWR